MGYDLFYKYHVMNHKGNWLGTFLDNCFINKEKNTSADLLVRDKKTFIESVRLSDTVYIFQTDCDCATLIVKLLYTSIF